MLAFGDCKKHLDGIEHPALRFACQVCPPDRSRFSWLEELAATGVALAVSTTAMLNGNGFAKQNHERLDPDYERCLLQTRTH